MLTTSPTSQAIALRQMTVGRAIAFDEAMRVEFRIVSRICRGRDFYEGVRATIVDKDGRRAGDPAGGRRRGEAGDRRLFRPAGAGEIAFPGVAR